MKATAQSKQEAYDQGYRFYLTGKRTRQDALNFDTSQMYPAEAWSWVRGWERAQEDYRSGQIK